MKRTPLKRIGPKTRREAKARAAFIQEVKRHAQGYCQRCGHYVGYNSIHAHHLRPRSLGGKHEEGNSAGVCGACHRMIHDHLCPDWKEWLLPAKKPEPPMSQ